MMNRMVKEGDSFLRVNFFGGEPLIKFQLMKDIVNELDSMENNIEISYGITTNLVLLNQEIIDFFIRNQVSIMVSRWL